MRRLGVISLLGLIFAFAAAVLPACGPPPVSDQPAPPLRPSPRPSVDKPGDIVWFYRNRHSAVASSPAVVGSVIYFGAGDGYVYAVDAATRKVIWRFQTGAGVFSSPTVVDGVVYVGSSDNHVYALDADTGEHIWRYLTGERVDSSPAVVDGVVYVGSFDDHVYALDAATGALIWRFHSRDSIDSSPAVADGVVFFGSIDRHVYAVDAATGELRWRFPTGHFVRSSPAVVDGVVYVGPMIATCTHWMLSVESVFGVSEPDFLFTRLRQSLTEQYISAQAIATSMR